MADISTDGQHLDTMSFPSEVDAPTNMSLTALAHSLGDMHSNDDLGDDPSLPKLDESVAGGCPDGQCGSRPAQGAGGDGGLNPENNQWSIANPQNTLNLLLAARHKGVLDIFRMI
jgi:hypothetical protein